MRERGIVHGHQLTAASPHWTSMKTQGHLETADGKPKDVCDSLSRTEMLSEPMIQQETEAWKVVTEEGEKSFPLSNKRRGRIPH